MPSPFRFAACCLVFGAPATAGNYPPPPGPYQNPAVQEWLAASTAAMLEQARETLAAKTQEQDPETATETPERLPPLVKSSLRQTGVTPAPVILADKDRWADAAKPAAWIAPNSPNPVPGQPTARLASASPIPARINRPRRGLLSPLLLPPRTSTAKPKTAPVGGGFRSTEELLALYLDYGPGKAGPQPNSTPAATRATPEAARPRSQRYYYRPTGTTFEFRSLDADPE